MDFMSGMVKVPVVTTLDEALPDTDPNRALDRTATLAGPPRNRPASEAARSMKTLPTPASSMKVPKRMKRNTYLAEADMATP